MARRSAVDTELDAAIQRIYERYGPNFSAFMEDVKRSIEADRRARES